MSCGLEYSSLVVFVGETKSFKNRKYFDKVMRVHTDD